MVPESLDDWLAANGYGRVSIVQSVGGGCINNGARIKTSTGQSFFLKTNPKAPEDMFEREAEGLLVLRKDEGPRVPFSYVFERSFILLEDLQPGQRAFDYWPSFGRRLAFLHNHQERQFGFEHDNYIGSTRQVNAWHEDGFEFFAINRLIFQARLAGSNVLLGNGDVNRVEKLARRLPELIPTQPASLLHGDLWGGNSLADEKGMPALIDPAVYFGWAEAELAMTSLFGSFPDPFYRAYQEVRPLEPGLKDRFPIYNLYHLLNHLNLFGMGYLGEVQSILDRFVGTSR